MNKKILQVIREKEEVLNGLRTFLRKEFVGLDTVIDQIIESIKVWYIFPELQIRPTTICLWGLTGTGKTDLVRKLVSYLKMQDKFLEIEMTDDSSSTQSIQSKMEDSSLSSDEPAILFLDEFQKFRTVNKEQEPTENKSYNDVWTLLSDGRFHSDLTKKTELLTELLYSKYYSDYNSVYNEPSKDKKKERDEKEKRRIYKTSVGLASKVKRLFRLTDSVENIMKYNEEQIFALYENHAKNPSIYEGEMYKKLLIIISGNLDEAYQIAKEVDEVDMDADWFHEYSKRLTVLDIKKALTKRFRPEQIARFGNSHVLYPSLSKVDYHQIIKIKCEQIGELIKSTKGIAITFDKSGMETIEKNGGFLTKGVRPLLSTITNILSSVLPTFIYNCLLEGAKELKVECNTNKMTGHFKRKSITLDIPVVLDSLREKIDEDTKYIVAVHELGHAVVYTKLFGVAPSQICTNSISSYSNGFIIRHAMADNKENIIKQLAVLLAGRAAENMVFGENFASTGAIKDIDTATLKAWSYSGRYGFDKFNGRVTSKGHENDGEIFDRQRIGEVTEKLLKEAKQSAEEILKDNLKFYHTALNHLIDTGKITPKQFEDMGKTHGLTIHESDTGTKLLLGYKKLTEDFINKNR